MTIDEILLDAIARHRFVILAKHDDLGLRIFQPHILYRTAARSAPSVEGFQTTNSGKPMDRPGWRTFHIEDIDLAELLDQPFRVRRDFDLHAAKYQGGILAHA